MIEHAVSLAAAVALLLFSVRLVRTGIERGFLAEIRVLLRRLAERTLGTALGGVAAALLLQSSAAVALIAGGFAATGMIPARTGLVMLLGADLGSALMAQILSLPVGAIVPFLLLAGVILFLNAGRRRTKQVGRILVGLAFVLMSLGMIRAAVEPIAAGAGLRAVAGYLSGDLPAALVLGAALGWLLHSGLAAVLVVVTFAATGAVTLPAGAALVLGANIGAGVVPVVLLWRSGQPARAIALGSLAARSAVAAAAFLALVAAPGLLLRLDATPGQALLLLHVGANALVALLAIPLAGRLVRLADIVAPPGEEAGPVSALDESALDKPRIAIACGQRELQRMAEQVHAMLSVVIGLFRGFDEAAAEAIARREAEVDRMHYAVKIYLSRLREAGLPDRLDARAVALVAMANSIEDAGDGISTGLVQQARKLEAGGLAFSAEGMGDIERFHQQVLGNARLALNVLTTGDAEDARQLVAEKDRIRGEEQVLQERHLRRLGEGNATSVATTNIHQETLRLLKQVNAALTYVAYPIAEEAGDLMVSRLAPVAAGRSG